MITYILKTICLIVTIIGVWICMEEKMSETTMDKWINIYEAAKYLGVKPGTIRDWIRKDKGIPAQKIGKQWKFKCSELDFWVKSGKSAID